MQTESIENRAVELLGEAMPVSRQPEKETVMSFREGHIAMSLKIITPFDKDAQEYRDSIPKIVLLVDGKYVRMPIDSKLLKDFGEFLLNLSQVVEGVQEPAKITNVENAREILQRAVGGCV